MSAEVPREWAAILADAISRPGVISQAYSTFWQYSIGNQLLAWFQCLERSLTPGPINTFLGWQKLNRFVKKGERALHLCMPVTCRSQRKVKSKDQPKDEMEMIEFTKFIYRPHWFVLSQTEGMDFAPLPIPNWEEERALENLNISRIEFDHLDGNTQGYARERTVAVSPIAFMPHRTLFHEVAHVVLQHTTELGQMDDSERTPVNVREVEAESVALICCESLGLAGADFSRGYIQSWLFGSQTIPERSAQRIFKAADLIIRAGRPQLVRERAESEP